MLRQRNFFQLSPLSAFKAVDWPETSLNAVRSQGGKEHAAGGLLGRGARPAWCPRPPAPYHNHCWKK